MPSRIFVILLYLPVLTGCTGCYSSGLMGLPQADADAESASEGGPDGTGQDGVSDTGTDNEMVAPEIPPDIDQDRAFDCEPPQGAWTYFTVDGTDWPRGERLDYKIRCSIPLISSGSWAMTFDLDCWADDGTYGFHQIVISTLPEMDLPDVPENEDVWFRYVAETSFWANRWFTITDSEGSLLLAGLDAERVLPQSAEEQDFYKPLSMSTAEGLCPVDPGDCGDIERLAVDGNLGDASIRVYDGTTSFIDAGTRYMFFVGAAERRQGTWLCGGERPETWLSAVFYKMR